MKNTMCIRCGAQLQNTHTPSFCDDCFLHKHDLINVSDFTFALSQCGKYYFSKLEKFDNFDDAIKAAIMKKMKTDNKIDSIKTRIKRHFGHKYQIIVTASGYIKPCRKQKIEEKEIIITIKNLTCEDCAKISGNYHEAKVQLRGEHLEELIKTTQNVLPKNSWVKENPDGYDVFFITKTDASNFVKNFKGKYEIKKSFKIVSQKKDRVLSRDCYVVR